jgi:hypothetical protein
MAKHKMKPFPERRTWSLAPHLEKKGVKADASPQIMPMSQIAGFQPVGFSFVDPGGPGNLLPGVSPNIQTATVNWPQGASSAVVFLQVFTAAYIDESQNISDHHLGQLMVGLFFKDSNTIASELFLRDNSNSEGVNIAVQGMILFFQ